MICFCASLKGLPSGLYLCGTTSRRFIEVWWSELPEHFGFIRIDSDGAAQVRRSNTS